MKVYKYITYNYMNYLNPQNHIQRDLQETQVFFFLVSKISHF